MRDEDCEIVHSPTLKSRMDIYYLPGRGGRLETGLGEALLSRGLNVSGRQTLGDFAKLSFAEQIELVAQDLKTHFWHDDAMVVANSFGAYLFLHAQTLMAPFPGRVLLLSPIVGEFANSESQTFFVPPRARQLMELVQAGRYLAPQHCEIHVGEQDWQSNPDNVQALAKLMAWHVIVVPEAGHMLPKNYVGALLDRWIH
jgi:pimeloyl-ACP methyl ester carboxylesterase